VSVLSKLIKAFISYRGKNICLDERMERPENIVSSATLSRGEGIDRLYKKQ